MIKTKVGRRDFIKNSAALSLGAATVINAPYVMAQKRPKLRVLGTHVTLQETLRLQAEKDLNIDIEFRPGGSAEVLLEASTKPESFDIYEQWSDSINILWRAGAIQHIDAERLTYWPEVNELTKTGKITPDAKIGAGDAPNKIIFVQPDGSLGPQITSKLSFMPYVHNTDSFGYNSTAIDIGIPYETESWGWLLDEEHTGKAALVNAPTIGIFDMALAAQARNMVTFQDIGNMKQHEVGLLLSIMIEMKQRGHFSGVWNSVPESVEFFSSGRATIASMFSPGISTLNGQGIPVVYAAPKEGYRAWHGVMCLSSKTEGAEKDAAYKFMNWWLSGWPGAFIARQGYYISNPDRSKNYLDEKEWNYWYEGKVAETALKGTDGNIVALPGSIRNGGSYVKRLSNIAVWNTVMDTYEYSLPLWHEFIIS